MVEHGNGNRNPGDRGQRQHGSSLHRDTTLLASTYEKTSVHHIEHGKRLVDALSIADGDCVLDIGAGTGHLAAHVAELVGSSGYVVAMDPLPLRIEFAKSKTGANFEACVGRAEDLSQFPDEAFNVVYLNSVFHWVEDKPRALAEIFRVLSPDGRLGITCPDPTRPHEAFQFIRRALKDVGAEHKRAVALIDLLTDYELERLMGAAGFASYESDTWTFANVYPDVETLLESVESASFGNFLVDSTDRFHAQLLDTLDRLLESKRRDDGSVELERYLMVAKARKPKSL